MNAFDPAAVQAMRDAQHYSDLCNEAERIERNEAEQDALLNKALEAIRKIELNPAKVAQILNTMGCQMAINGFSAGDLQAVDDLADCLS
jgi:hypothetical protein